MVGAVQADAPDVSLHLPGLPYRPWFPGTSMYLIRSFLHAKPSM